MNTAVTPRLTLEEVAEHFAQWRSHKKKGERISERLWSEAIGLLGAYSVSQVTRSLRLSGADLNKHRGMMDSGKARKSADREMAFVEIDRTLVEQTLMPNAQPGVMELQRPDGWRLRVEPANRADMLALVERFMGV